MSIYVQNSFVNKIKTKRKKFTSHSIWLHVLLFNLANKKCNGIIIGWVHCLSQNEDFLSRIYYTHFYKNNSVRTKPLILAKKSKNKLRTRTRVRTRHENELRCIFFFSPVISYWLHWKWALTQVFFFFMTFCCIIAPISGIIDNHCIMKSFFKKIGKNKNKLKTI